MRTQSHSSRTPTKIIRSRSGAYRKTGASEPRLALRPTSSSGYPKDTLFPSEDLVINHPGRRGLHKLVDDVNSPVLT